MSFAACWHLLISKSNGCFGCVLSICFFFSSCWPKSHVSEPWLSGERSLLLKNLNFSFWKHIRLFHIFASFLKKKALACPILNLTSCWHDSVLYMVLSEYLNFMACPTVWLSHCRSNGIQCLPYLLFHWHWSRRKGSSGSLTWLRYCRSFNLQGCRRISSVKSSFSSFLSYGGISWLPLVRWIYPI